MAISQCILMGWQKLITVIIPKPVKIQRYIHLSPAEHVHNFHYRILLENMSNPHCLPMTLQQSDNTSIFISIHKKAESGNGSDFLKGQVMAEKKHLTQRRMYSRAKHIKISFLTAPLKEFSV